MDSAFSIAVLIPCFNEETTIAKVVNDFRCALPEANIYVYDNNSTDNTIQEAIKAGAIVRKELLQGKGHVVRRMFADINADIYLMVDGDSTYHSASARNLVNALINGPFDMVNGSRISQDKNAYRMGHTLGNKLLTMVVAKIFGKFFKDMLSGYRVFSRRFVKSFPCLSEGFEIETELTIHALSLRMPIAELETPYHARPPGSFSKLSTFSDGFRILRMIVHWISKERPLLFFSILGLLFILAGLLIGTPIVFDFLRTGLVLRLPSAVLAASLVILSFLSMTCGLILDTVTRGRREAKQIIYLSYPAPGQ